jgi:hypothetical protein
MDQTRRAVTIRSILVGAFFCVILGVAIPYFDILKPTSELGGSHFPVGAVFSLTAIILLLNIPLKTGSAVIQVIFGLIIGGFASFLVWHLGPWSPTANLITTAVLLLMFGSVVPLIGKGGPLNAKELLVIFSMMLICSGIPTFGLISQLFPMITSWQHLAPGRGWTEAFFKYIPEWMVVGDPQHMIAGRANDLSYDTISETHYLAIKWFYEGLPQDVGIAQVPWHQWAKPLASWGIFIAFLYGYMFCLTSILRKQWVEKEKLLFPLMQLPVEMAKAEDRPGILSPLFKNKFLLVGAGIPFVIHSALQLQYYILGPSQGASFLRTRSFFFDDTSLQAFGAMPLYVYFAVIGFCYLLSTEITLSVWLFFALNRFQRVVYDWMGTPGLVTSAGQPGAAQFIGALVVFVLFGLYAARSHLWDVFRKAFTGAPDVDDSAELIGYRASVFGIMIALAGLIGWCMFMGMQWWVALMVFFGFTMVIIGITRAVCEGGLLFVKLESAKPVDFMRNLTGTSPISASSLTVLSFIQYVSMFDLKTLLMPALMQGCKARDTVNDRSKKTLWAFILAVVIVILVSGAATLWGCYTTGANNVHGWYYISGPRAIAFDPLKNWIQRPTSTDWTGVAYMIGGGLFSGFLIFMRRSFVWWPLHPLGYIMAQGYFESSRIAFSFFIGWMIKSGVLRFAGGRWFKRLRPFFLGLILGEFGAAGLWILIGLILQQPGPRVFP